MEKQCNNCGHKNVCKFMERYEVCMTLLDKEMEMFNLNCKEFIEKAKTVSHFPVKSTTYDLQSEYITNTRGLKDTVDINKASIPLGR